MFYDSVREGLKGPMDLTKGTFRPFLWPAAEARLQRWEVDGKQDFPAWSLCFWHIARINTTFISFHPRTLPPLSRLLEHFSFQALSVGMGFRHCWGCCRGMWSWPQHCSLCTTNKPQQAITTSVQRLEQPVLPEGVKANGLGPFCMSLDIVLGGW